MFESLEQRRMLAVAVNVTGGVLTINGDKNANVINVVEVGGNVHLETSTLPGGAITSQDLTGITKININGGAGNDVIFYDGDTVGATIHGDNAGKNGNGGSSGGSGLSNSDSNGRKGDDQITVTDDGSASSIIYGDRGNDVLTVVVGNSTTVSGGDGADQIYLNTGLDPSDLVHGKTFTDAGDGNDTITTYGGMNTILGGKGKDTLIDLGGTNTFSDIETVI
jgi:Ca2+-binding RTX toxin-like protein